MKARWLARSFFVLMLGAAAVLVGFARLQSLAMVGVGAVGACLILAGGYWFLAHRGVVRWLAFGLVVLTPIAILVVFALNHLIWVALVAIALILLAGGAAQRALAPAPGATGMPIREVPPPKRAFLIMNPKSGGGKVTKFDLKDKAEALGAQVALLEGPGEVDVAALARQAVADGADLLGVAGGDGTQALVAGIAAEHDLPFLVISAGTRNHFAMDLGLDRDDPSTCLVALTDDGVEQRIDLGVIGDRTFVNNASFGAYAEIVESPAYRDDKRGTTLQTLPDLLSGHRGAKLTAHAGDTTVAGPQAVLVSNNQYEISDIAGLGRRARLDAGTLGFIAVTVNNALQAVMLLRGAQGQGVTALAAGDVVIEADTTEIPVGIDGETVMMPAPVRCTIRPKALRVRVPRHRPGVLAAAGEPRFHWSVLWKLAFSRSDERAGLLPG
jgi:diacylglycerol kinase family enzyme